MRSADIAITTSWLLSSYDSDRQQGVAKLL